VNCDAARLAIGADPDSATPELEHHLSGCSACGAYQKEMRTLEAKLRQALASTPAEVIDTALVRSRGRASPRRGLTPSRGWALAATIVAAIAAALLLWGLRPPTSLAADVIHHVDGEPQSWSSTSPVGSQPVERLLAAAGVTLADPEEVVYARMCRFRGHEVPHLVVTVDHRPYTVMILRFESVPTAQHFNEGGYAGMIVPIASGSTASGSTASGSIAIVGLGAADVDGVARDIERQLRVLR
jgi:hypothetical protein